MSDFITYFINNSNMVLASLRQHVVISLTALTFGFLAAFPAGIYLTRHKKAASAVLGIFSAVNTIPSIVMLGVAMILLGVGFLPAVTVLFIYSLLPIMRNTYTGIRGVSEKYIKASKGMGMSSSQIMMKVQIPLALPIIIAGLRLSTIYIISWATLSAFIGAGGLGDLIWMGLQSYNFNLVLCGAIPSTLLAFAASIILSFAEKVTSSRLHTGGEAA